VRVLPARLTHASIDRVTTPRLRGERATRADGPFLGSLLQDPRVAATLGGVRSDVEVEARLERHVRHWETHGFGYWFFLDRETDELVGCGGLQVTRVGGREDVELGYAVAADRWGAGLATEMAQASVAVAFDDLGLDEVIAFALTTNTASRRVMEKVGFEYDRDITHARAPHALYRLRARR
jgi:RimJ/RimL family protein N-acetyltransferase